MQKKNYLRNTLALVMAFLMIVTMLPVNVFAEPTNPGQGSNLPSNRVSKVNWDKSYDKTSNIWKLNQAYNLTPAQQLVKVSSADPIDNFGLNYEGYFVNAEGRTVLRLVYHESSTAASTWWHNLLFKFDKDLFSKIDFSKSFIEYFNGKKLQFYDTQGANEKALKIRDLIWTDIAGWKHNMPIDLVLNDGVQYSDLTEDYLIQMRFATPTLDKIYTFAPGKSPMDYSSYTKATVVAVNSDINNAFMRGPKPQSALIAGQRSFMTEYDNEAQNINQKPNTDKTLAVLKTQYQWEHASMNKANTIDGKPFGYMIAFDASLVPYLKADTAGNVGYTTLQNVDKVENKGNAQYPYIKTALKLNQINYTQDRRIAYFVLAEKNFVKTGVNVVTIGQMDGSIYQGTDNFTNIDFVVDKNMFINTFSSDPDKEQIRFGVVAGWVESNPKGMTIFEKTFDHDVDIPAGGNINIDTSGAPEGGQIMVQVGDGDNFIKRFQPYYNALRNVSNLNGFDGMDLLADGIYSVPYRTGIKIKAGEKLRVYLPDTSDNGDVRLFYLNNATAWNQGGVNLKFDNQKYNGEINVHLGKVPDHVDLIYTLEGQSTPTTTNFTKGFTWKHNGGSELKTINASILDTGGDYILYKSMLEPGTEVIAKAYSKTGEVRESSIKYDAFIKSSERYEDLVITDNSDVLSSLVINKSVLVPYQQVYTNDYTQGQDDFYKNVVVQPANVTAFNTKTTQLVGYASYDGGPVRMRFLPNTAKTYLGNVDATASERDNDGFITDPKTSKVTVGNKEYDKYEYTVNIADMVDSSDNTTIIPEADKTLKKDMRIIVNNSDGSSIPSDWYETRVRTRVLFDLNKDMDFNVDNGITDSIVKVVPDNQKFLDEDNYTANGFSTTSGAYLKDMDGNDLTGNDLELRKWPEKPANITVDGIDKQFLGWSTKQVTEEEFANLATLTDVNQWATAATTGYKVTENSPFDSHQVLYAVYGQGYSAVFNPEQKYDEATDKQYIEAKLKDGETQPTDATYKLVKKNDDGTYTPVENLTSTEVNGKTVFDITDLTSDKFDPNADYYIETTESGKTPSYSDKPIKIDKQAPVESTTQGEELKATPDLFKYMVKITGKAKDADHKILKATVEANGKTVAVNATKDDTNFTIELNDDTLKQLGEAKSYKVTIYDIMGNKLEKTLEVAKVDQELELRLDELRAGKSEIFLKSKTGAELTIRVIRNKKPITLDKVAATSDEAETITLKQGGAEFKLEKGDRIIIDAKLTGYKDARILKPVR